MPITPLKKAVYVVSGCLMILLAYPASAANESCLVTFHPCHTARDCNHSLLTNGYYTDVSWEYTNGGVDVHHLLRLKTEDGVRNYPIPMQIGFQAKFNMTLIFSGDGNCFGNTSVPGEPNDHVRLKICVGSGCANNPENWFIAGSRPAVLYHCNIAVYWS